MAKSEYETFVSLREGETRDYYQHGSWIGSLTCDKGQVIGMRVKEALSNPTSSGDDKTNDAQSNHTKKGEK